MEWILTVIASVIVAFVTARLSMKNEREKIEKEHAAQLERLREELKLEYSIETAIRHLLNHPSYKKRGLAKIKHHLRGFKDDNELRTHLMRAGAVSFSGKDKEEMWGLLERNLEDVK